MQLLVLTFPAERPIDLSGRPPYTVQLAARGLTLDAGATAGSRPKDLDPVGQGGIATRGHRERAVRRAMIHRDMEALAREEAVYEP